ncbi:MAG: hypothetical protein Q7S62_00425 [bacterium]|nr:hypothetical protein [bacterium]
MNKKLIIAGVVLLLIIGGGLFLLLGGTATKSRLGESGSDTIPTQWSQAGDYEIKEVAGQQTVVTNSKAGFSFKVPEGWSAGTQYFSEEEFTLEFLSPDAVKREGNPPLNKGCGIGLTTFFREDLWESWNNDVLRVQQNPGGGREGEKIIKVGGKSALWDALNAHDLAAIEILGEIIRVNVPISNNGVIELGITMMPDRQSNCKAEFNTFLSSFSID